ncbi:MAG: glutamate--tRNA ligase [Pseudomonadales bacterium]
MKVRTRIAPSPTGDPHVGTAYIALFNRAFALHHGGEFILRLEDTDAARSTSASERKIFEALRWLGLAWTEGPDVGGPCGPYRQSERLPIYREHVAHLLATNHAFHCFCTAERLDGMRQEQRARGETTRYDGHCLSLTADTVAARLAAGESHVIRMKVPQEGSCQFDDMLRGRIEIPWSQVDMQVLIKADGYPTYHLAVVVDDHLMAITHVLRGEEWINSVPKHQLLYRYFGWDMPAHAHLPLLRNPDHSKLSKRKNPTSISYYRDIGILPEALLNYLGMMGWSMPDEREIFSADEMTAVFDLRRVSLGGPVFDLAKLSWLNGQYLRNLPADEFADRLAGWMFNRARLATLIPVVQQRTERLADLVGQVDYLVGDRRCPPAEAFQALKAPSAEIIDHTLRAFETLVDWERDALFDCCQSLAAFFDLKLKDFLQPLFLAISGKSVSLPLFDSLVFLGSDVTRVRLREALDVIGVSKKAAKQLEKNYASYLATRDR